MDESVAVVAYALRVPGARTVDVMWDISSSARDVISRTTHNTGLTGGNRVRAYGVMDSPFDFDPEYFQMSAREAETIDPQQRQLLICAHELVEQSALGDMASILDIGTFTATGMNGHVLRWENPFLRDDGLPILIGNDPKYSATRIAYKFALTGPAVSVGTACSSSLVAIHYACQSILEGESDAAIAGGMDIEVPQPRSYLYQEGGILAADGVCRPFDSLATGTVFGSGGGLTFLARTSLAEELNLPILSVIRGSAINNDGAAKLSFTAPSSSRQAAVMQQALNTAEISPADIAYLECHGTGTSLGDASELDAIEAAYGANPDLIIGSAKANFGHLRVGAGILGFIRASEAVRRQTSIPLANFTSPSERLQQLMPNASLRLGTPQLLDRPGAAVSSFGFGGTNVHLVLEKYDRSFHPRSQPCAPVVIPVSATSPEACLATADAIADALKDDQIVPREASITLAQGRSSKPYRYAVVGDTLGAIRNRLSGTEAGAVEGWATQKTRVALVFPGQDAQILPHVRPMLRHSPDVTSDLTAMWCAVCMAHGSSMEFEAAVKGYETLSTPLRIALDVAAAISVGRDLIRRGMKPTLIGGYSIGEYPAAVVAGAMDAEEALTIIVKREHLFKIPPSQISAVVACTVEQLHDIWPSAAHAMHISVNRQMVALDRTDFQSAEQAFRESGIALVKLEGLKPYHTHFMAPWADAMRNLDAETTYAPAPALKLSADKAMSRGYWAHHLAHTLNFTSIVDAAQDAECTHVVDLSGGYVGRAFAQTDSRMSIVQLFPSNDSAEHTYQKGLASLWVQGIDIDVAPSSSEAIPRITLPATILDERPYEKQSEQSLPSDQSERLRQRNSDLSNWTFSPTWTMLRRPDRDPDIVPGHWLVLSNASNESRRLLEVIRNRGQRVSCLVLEKEDLTAWETNNLRESIRKILNRGQVDRVLFLHLRRADTPGALTDVGAVKTALSQGFYPLLHLIQELASIQGARDISMHIVASSVHPLNPSNTNADPTGAFLLGAALVAPQDLPFIRCKTIDVTDLTRDRIETIVSEISFPIDERMITLTDSGRWARRYEHIELPVPEGTPRRLRKRGVYLITGGLGGIGMTLARNCLKRG